MRETILIVDDDPSVLQCLRRIVARQCGEMAILAASDFRQALTALARCEARRRPLAAALLDVVLPGGSGLELIPLIKGSWPQARIIVMSGVCGCKGALQAQQAGARFLPKPLDAAAVAAALREKPPSLDTATTRLDAYARAHDLSGRQQQVVEGWMNGQSGKEIAAALGVSVNTVAKHAQRIFDKSGCRSKTSVVKAVFSPSATVGNTPKR